MAIPYQIAKLQWQFSGSNHKISNIPGYTDTGMYVYVYTYMYMYMYYEDLNIIIIIVITELTKLVYYVNLPVETQHEASYS